MSRFTGVIKYLLPLPAVALATGAMNAPAAHAGVQHPEPRVAPDLHVSPDTNLGHDKAAAAAAAREAVKAESFTYMVRPGDTLSSIAKHLFGHAHYWPAVWKANEHKIHNPNVLTIGESLAIPGTPAKVSAKLSAEAYAAIPVVHAAPAHAVLAASTSTVPVHHYACGDGDGDGMDMPCSQLDGGSQPAQASAPSAASNVSAYVNPSGYGSFQACVISRESGGNSAVMNSTGHYGLYQFSYQTWVANGGSAGSFGHASVAEQNQVFANTMATGGGASNWSPYDGC